MKLRITLILVGAFVLLILCICSVFRIVVPPLPPPTPTPLPPDWFSDWLTDPVCQPPCWQGVTPGVTTITDTYKIVQKLPGVVDITGPGRPVFETAGMQLDWSFTPPSSGGGMAFAFDDGRVSSLGIGGILSTPLEKVIEIYGFPSHVFIPSCMHGDCDTALIYMETGMVVGLFLDRDRDAEGDVTVTPESSVTGIDFFPPGEEGYLSAYPQFSDNFPVRSSPWAGYTKYFFLKKKIP